MSGMASSGNITFWAIFLCLHLCTRLTLAEADSSEECANEFCYKPLIIKYYEDLKCTPIFNDTNTCCPIEYNCTIFDELDTERCYINGHDYDIGDTIDPEDRSNLCDTNCTCERDENNRATIQCTTKECPEIEVPEGCYLQRNLLSCCNEDVICPEDINNTTVCTVDEVTYMDGDHFTPNGNPEMLCTCSEEYSGLNVPPACEEIKSCRPAEIVPSNIFNKCAPIYQEYPLNCYSGFRCPRDDDMLYVPELTISDIDIRMNASPEEVTNDSLDQPTCSFGDLLIKVGERVIDSDCVRCTCVIPPLLSCNVMPEMFCNSNNSDPDVTVDHFAK